MIRSSKRLRLCTALLVCNLAFIWGNSLLPGDLSGAFSNWVKSLLVPVFPSLGEEDGTGGFLLRKLAHFTEFAALGALLSWLFGMLAKGKTYPLVCGAAAACVDETIQMFVPDRGPGIRDVLIDCGGVFTGMILLYLGHTWYKRKQLRSLEEM
jgi:VanZ family protein